MGLMSIRQISCGENHTLALVDMLVIEEASAQESPESKEDETTITTKLFVWGLNDKR